MKRDSGIISPAISDEILEKVNSDAAQETHSPPVLTPARKTSTIQANLKNRLEDLFDNEELSDEDSLSIKDEDENIAQIEEVPHNFKNKETEEICENFRGTVSQPLNLIETGKPSENPPIVADLGSMWSRIGFSSEEKPQIIQR